MENLGKYNKFWAACGQTIGALIMTFGGDTLGLTDAQSVTIGMAILAVCNGLVYAVRNRKSGTDLSPLTPEELNKGKPQ